MLGLLETTAFTQNGLPAVFFTNQTQYAGITLINVSGSSQKRYIVETTGSGACFLDYDSDGDMDLYFVNGATLATLGPANATRNALYRNEGDGRFTDVTDLAGVGDNGWGGGCYAADYNNDGHPDLYITNYGPNVLYGNNGEGTFLDVTAKAGVGGKAWSTGATFVDVDRDGDLDLYVANYLHFDHDQVDKMPSDCYWKLAQVMCGPRGFEAQADILYQNNGDDSFTDISAEGGISGLKFYGLGVVAGDLDNDSDADIFVVNDSQSNMLLVNDGTGRFRERALAAGVALSGDGREQAGMGVDIGDYDGDGDQDLAVTNFSDDYHTLYRNDGDGLFTDVSSSAGLDPATRSSLGWGIVFFDYDNDGYLDLFVANGHVYPQVDTYDAATSYRQRNLLLRNQGDGRFAEISEDPLIGLSEAQPSRGAAVGDYDDDGDLDLVVVNENELPVLLRNNGGNAAHWFKVRLIGRQSNRDGVGTRLELRAGQRTQVREMRLNAGYYTSHDPRVHFGLGSETGVARLEVRWPSGKTHVLSDLPADRLLTLDEERGLVALVPLKSERTNDPVSPPSLPSVKPATSNLPSSQTGVTGRLSAVDLHEIDTLVQSGTRSIMAGEPGRGIRSYQEALARLPSWEEAANSPDALGFGDPIRYRTFLSALYDNLGVALMRAERLEECPQAIHRAISILPDRAKYHHNLGLCYFHDRRYMQAVEAMQRARSIDQNRAGISYDLGRALALAGKCSEAVKELKSALGELPDPDLRGRRAEAWHHLGICHALSERHQDAARAFRETLALLPGHQEALYRLASSLRREGKSTAADRLQNLFQARRSAEEKFRSMRQAGLRSANERLLLAQAYLDARLPPQALREAQSVLTGNPQIEPAWLVAGQAALAFRTPHVGIAETAFRNVLRLNGTNVDALAGLGETYRLSGRPIEAREVLLRALAMQPDHAAATVALARLELASGQAGEAANRLRRVLEREPRNQSILFALAAVYVSPSAGESADAREALRLVDRGDARYGEGTETQLRALVLLKEIPEAERLLQESPFLGQLERTELRRLF